MKLPLKILILSGAFNLSAMDSDPTAQQEIVNSISDQFFTDINPLLSYAHIPKELKKLKKKLNSDFIKNAQINGLVSYIYYPSAELFGHSELEIEGDSWTLLGDKLYNRSRKQSLDSKIKKIRKSDSQKIIFPFFRYVIAVTPEQIDKLRKSIGTKVSFPCSKAALLELSRSCDYNVPFLFKKLPLASGIYLHCANKSGSKRVKNIQFYGHEKPIKNLTMILPGVFCEVLIVFAITCLISIVYKLVVLIYNEDNCPIEEYY